MTAPDIWTVDRVESGTAVLFRDADAQVAELPLYTLPAGTHEGSVLRVPDAETGPDWASAELDEELRAARLDEAEQLLERLRHRDPGGDVVL